MMDKSMLLNFLKIIGSKLQRKITLVAAGGTAMTLLDLKTSTIDIDFTGPSSDIDEFDSVQKTVPHGFKIDQWKEGMVYVTQLPDDYLSKSIVIQNTGIENITLRSLHPIDIVLTKVARMSGRDEEDIRSCISKFGLSKQEVLERGKIVAQFYPANETVYLYKLEDVIENYFN